MMLRKRSRTDPETFNLTPGTFVWAQLKANDWWPGLIINPEDAGLRPAKATRLHVFWFGDHRVSEVFTKNVCDFKEFFSLRFKSRKNIPKHWSEGVMEAILELGYPHIKDWNEPQLLRWALNNFPSDKFCFSFNKRVPEFVAKRLADIKSLNTDSDADDEVREPTFRVKALIDAALTSQQRGEFCLGCYAEIAPDEHPLFNGKMCNGCKIRIKHSMHAYGDDGIAYFCSVCGNPGNMIVCSEVDCGKGYCDNCMENLTMPDAKLQIKKIDSWTCFFCMKQTLGGLIQPRSDWKTRVSSLFENTTVPLVPSPEIPEQKTKLRVLSLFDGIGTGFLVLEKLKISIEAYFACEIDEDALNVTQTHFGEHITHLGDVRELSEEKLRSLLPIDLLIGGSPCNDLSLANPNRKGLHDFSGTGVVFFEFYRIISRLQRIQDRPFFWFFENVASMPLIAKETISRFLQCEPKLFDAVSVSPQHRPRLFWGNLPSLHAQLPLDEGPQLQEYLMPHRTATVSKLGTVTTRSNSLRQGPDMTYPVKDYKNKEDTIWITELEEIFGFPQHFTDLADMSSTKRQQLVGKAWSVQIICYLFRCLTDYFQLKH